MTIWHMINPMMKVTSMKVNLSEVDNREVSDTDNAKYLE